MLLVLVIVALAALAGVIYAVQQHNTNVPAEKVPQKQDAPAQTSEQAAQNNQPAQDLPAAQGLSVANVRASEENDVVAASADITGGGSTKDTCVFTFTNSIAKPVVRQVLPTQSGSGVTCNSGNIPAQEFSAIGTWKLTVNYYAGGAQAAGTANVDIN